MVQDHGFRLRIHGVRELYQVVGRFSVNRLLIVAFRVYWTYSMESFSVSLARVEAHSIINCKRVLLMRLIRLVNLFIICA